MKAIGLFSGGLDSVLATKLMLDQGIDVQLITFKTPFIEKSWAVKMADYLGMETKVIETGKDYMEMVKKPRYGYGKNMNPCIACRIFMLKGAKEIMVSRDFDFIFTGEVLGQRPMSQTKKQLEIIERESDLEGLVLRPLSAGLLKPTMPERKGFVDRDRLLSIRGRGRKAQIELAKRFGLKEYDTPSGGCLLTDPNFSGRLRETFEHGEDDIDLLKYGRHFRLPSGKKVVVGRNEGENEILAKLATAKDLLLEVLDVPGPITLLRDSKNPEDTKICASICLRYSDCKGKGRVKISNGDYLLAEPLNEKRVEEMRI